MTARIEFFYDYGSPYSYIANANLPGLLARTGAQRVMRPMLLGGVFKATGNQSPAFESCEPKRNYGGQHLARWVGRLDLPFQMNPHFPINTITLMRAAVAAQREGVFDAYHDAVFPAMWRDGLDMGQESVFRDVMKQAGIDADRLLTLAADADVKGALRATTEEAVSRGVFGAPTFFFGDELYFGVDHMVFLEEAITAAA